ncbi:hypothetical protein HZB96_02265 [Candidatus Gottesmanbacteria bacterium]|nr:hypothetical protein [Candidatus Gottesmanbacteria bacterium]
MRSDITKLYEDYNERVKYRALGDRKVVYVTDSSRYDSTRPFREWEYPLFITGKLASRVQRKDHLPFLSPQAKAILLTDPKIWLDARVVTEVDGLAQTNSLCPWGTRNLIDPLGHSYYRNKDDLKKLLETTREAQKKNPTDEIAILDIGGSNGLAANELEQMEGHSSVTNLTREPQLGVFPLRGGHLLGLAERLPQQFSRSFDLVLSRTAFTYMRYPHIALINALYTLKVGGVMDISFDWRKSTPGKDGQLEMLDREVPLVFDWLDGVRQEGIVRYLSGHNIKRVKELNRVYPPDGRIQLLVEKPLDLTMLDKMPRVGVEYM